MLLSALVVKGIVPGAEMLAPEAAGGHLGFVFSLAWMIVIANVLAVILTWGATRWLVATTRIRSALLVPILLLLVCIGAFAERNLVADLVIATVAGGAGLAFAYFGWPRAPLLVGLVLGSIAETRLLLATQAYGANWLLRPGVVIIGAVIVMAVWAPFGRRSPVPAPADLPGRLPATRRGEGLLTSALLMLCVAGLASTRSFASGAELFPRSALALAIVLLAALSIGRARHADGTADAAFSLDRMTVGAAIWVPLFVALIWALGFIWGATLAVFAHLVVHERDRPAAILTVTLVAYVLLEVVMSRLLHVPFPAGAVLEGAHSFGVR
jgi:hypothetical protein